MLRATLMRALLAAIAVGGFMVAVAALPVGGDLGGARAWAKSLSTGERAAYSGERFVSLPRVYRKAIFEATPPERRKELWRSTFASYRRSHTLSGDQSRVLDRAESLLDAQDFSQLLNVPRKEAVRKAKEEVRSVLGSQAEEQLFMTGGPEVLSAPSLPTLERLRFAARLNRPTRVIALLGHVVPQLQAATQCNCLYTSDCYYYQTCGNPNGQTCDVTETGCGWWWLEACGSICYYPV